ncbi:MAG: hypothetical protein SOU27_10605 [Sodaliphilus sp.]|nr:hypothetical protein [Sodaliphilus sp.]
MDATLTLYYTLALVVAFSLLGLIFTRNDSGPAVTNIVALDLHPGTATAGVGVVELMSLDSGEVLLSRRGMALHDGETVNLVATITGDKMKIVEKKGVVTAYGEEWPCEASAVLGFVPPRRLNVRYESEVNGQWCTFLFLNLPGNHKLVEMHY